MINYGLGTMKGVSPGINIFPVTIKNNQFLIHDFE